MNIRSYFHKKNIILEIMSLSKYNIFRLHYEYPNNQKSAHRTCVIKNSHRINERIFLKLNFQIMWKKHLFFWKKSLKLEKNLLTKLWASTSNYLTQKIAVLCGGQKRLAEDFSSYLDNESMDFYEIFWAKSHKV